MPIAKPSSVSLKARLFRGFFDPSRPGILEPLRQGPCTVSELVDATGLSQPNASNHLACLLDCGLELLAEVARGVPACAAYPQGTLHPIRQSA